MSRTHARRFTQLALASLLFAGGAQANTYRLDDTGTHTVPPNVQMQWRPLSSRGGAEPGMEAWLRVNIRIATAAWAGRSGRVYMVLPRDESSTVEAVWTTQGRLLPGRLSSGERALVYAGALPAATLEDQIHLRLRTGADWASVSRRLNFHFEFDAD